jgi:transcriptional regulator with XRE-family HTH domain
MLMEPESVETGGGFGGRLTEARVNSGLERKSLARLLSVSEKTIASWENGRTIPRANRMQTLAGVLSVSVGWLMAEIGEGPVERSDETDVERVQARALEEIAEIRQSQRSLNNRLGELENLLRELDAAA